MDVKNKDLILNLQGEIKSLNERSPAILMSLLDQKKKEGLIKEYVYEHISDMHSDIFSIMDNDNNWTNFYA